MAEAFGKRLRRLRTAQKITMKELAQKIGVPVSTYREWEYGRSIVGEPYPRLADALRVSLSELLLGDAHNKNELFVEIYAIEDHLLKLKRKVESFL